VRAATMFDGGSSVSGEVLPRFLVFPSEFL
jgi:hypothetical protein